MEAGQLQLAVERASARPTTYAAERRIEGPSQALGRGEREALVRAAPEASKAVERALVQVAERARGKGLGLGR